MDLQNGYYNVPFSLLLSFSFKAFWSSYKVLQSNSLPVLQAVYYGKQPDVLFNTGPRYSNVNYYDSYSLFSS